MRFLCVWLIILSTPLWSEPIAVYTTWHDDPVHTLTICWISPHNEIQNQFQYGIGGWEKADVKTVRIPTIDRYRLHTVQLNSLQPDTTYKFRIEGSNKTYYVKTMPKSLNRPLRFVVGGDLYQGTSTHFQETNSIAVKTNPDFALVGGDLAYSKNKEKQDFQRWLTFLTRWSHDMVTPDGRMVPILSSTSNEDTNGNYDQTPSQAPFFYTLFVPENSNGYRVLDFGNYMSIWLLDSQHTNPVAGKQTRWLAKTLEQRKEISHKFAIYHVPAYPSVRSPTKRISRLIRRHWTPLFDRYGVRVAFENHDHAYKRTPFIHNHHRADHGVLYIGDGGWGVESARRPKERWYLEKTASKRHFIKATLKPDGHLFLEAIDSHGKIFDEVKLQSPELQIQTSLR